MLFSALHLGSRISHSLGQENLHSHDDRLSEMLLTRAAQSLIAGHYQKARPYSVEAVMLYGMCKFFQKYDSDIEPWLLMGIGARLALRMGYHRDPRHFVHISPFEGEMRRRTFSLIQAFELLLSFQAGLPAILHEEFCDVESPRNLLDEDFDEFCATLPPSRPPNDPTPMLYYCYKGGLAKIFGRVARQALSPRLPSYENVMSLDRELQKLHSEIPPSLEWRSLGSSITDESYTIMHRLNLELLYQKSLIFLHRRYLSLDRANPTFDYSRKTCRNAGLRVLEYQAAVYNASQPGGQLHNEQWTNSDLTLHDFLLAAMITCLDLYESYRQNESRNVPDTDSDAQRQQFQALKTSHDIWVSRKTTSPDAKRASSILAIMLSKIPRPAQEASSSSSSHTYVNGASNSDTITEESASALGGNAHETMPIFEPVSVGTGPPLSENKDQTTIPGNDSRGPLDAIFNNSDSVDWVCNLVALFVHPPAGQEC